MNLRFTADREECHKIGSNRKLFFSFTATHSYLYISKEEIFIIEQRFNPSFDRLIYSYKLRIFFSNS
jgi:hypothetical protein